MKKKNINDEDLRKIIEKAHELTTTEQNNLTLEDVKKTAEELGISPEKVSIAYDMIEQEKKEHTVRKKYLRTLSIQIVVILLTVVAIIYWNFRLSTPPKAYQGKVKMTITSELNETNLANELKEVRLFQYNKIYSYLKFTDIERVYRVECRFIDPEGNLFDQAQLELFPNNGDVTAWAPLNLPMSSPTGEWKVEVWIEDKLYQSFPMKVSYGHFNATLTTKIGIGNLGTPRPEDIKDTYVKGQDEVVICYLYWSLLSEKRAGEIVWKWIAPDGILALKEAVITKPLGMGWFRANHGLTLDEAQVGQWKVEVYYSDIKIETLEFTVK